MTTNSNDNDDLVACHDCGKLFPRNVLYADLICYGCGALANDEPGLRLERAAEKLESEQTAA